MVQKVLAPLAGAAILAALLALPAHAQNPPCADCHAAIAKKSTVHADFCDSCHEGLDARVMPHKTQGKSAKQRAAEGPDLCFGCHDKAMFKGKVAHAPVESGLCLTCHDLHGSDYQGLLRKDTALLCLDCHPDIQKGPHVIAGFSRSGHPLGAEPLRQDENGKPIIAEDPLRPGKKFYCAACHEPHRSEYGKLTRFPGKSMEICLKCHKK